MRLGKYLLNELYSQYGKGITFVDVDETIFKTFAMIKVIDKESGEVIKKLNNQEYNTYKLKDNEDFDFGEFRNAEFFRKTSIPIPQTIKRIKRMFQNIDRRGSKIILLTARADFDNKEPFLEKFRDHGIPIDNIYVERAGNLKGTVASVKKKVIMKYLSTGEYRRVRLIDDDMTNVKEFVKMGKEIPSAVIDKIKQIHDIPDDEKFPVIQFFGLLVKSDGSLKRIK